MNLIRTGNPAAIGGDFFRDPVPLNGRTVIRLDYLCARVQCYLIIQYLQIWRMDIFPGSLYHIINFIESHLTWLSNFGMYFTFTPLTYRFQADKKASNVNVCRKSTLYGSRALCKALPRGKGH